MENLFLAQIMQEESSMEVIPYIGNVQIKQKKLSCVCSPQCYEDV